ncbi:MAG: prephenate dehydrogenase [Actinomycetota bacterium]|nr:prephenate dehydrogenase [Actinomycetota bacterium]
MVEHVAVVGTGLIGGSIALGLRRSRTTASVVGYDDDPASMKAALDTGALTSAAASPEEAVSGADLVVLAMPVDQVPVACDLLANAVPRAAIITDVGSAKVDVVAHGEAAFGEWFVGGHPMAGSERHGIGAAEAELFDSAWWILTPTPRTSPTAYRGVAHLATELGAKAVAVDPLVHDTLVARLSHLPQLTASALVETAATAGDRDALLGLAAGGFRDVTRIAASNPDLWVAILRSNRAAVLEALGALRGRLARLGGMIEAGDWAQLREFLDAARRARLDLFSKPTYAGTPVALSTMIPDRPGVLAEVTTAAGELGANIEDLRIVHSSEGGKGRLELIVAGETPAELLTSALTALGYRVEWSGVDKDV